MTLRPTKKHSFDIVYDSQQVYRLILTAMSNPAKVVNIKQYADKLFGDHPVFLAMAMTLLDNEVGFNACENIVLSDEIASMTLALKTGIETADFIFVTGNGGGILQNHMEHAIENAKCGTHADPHKSAAIIIQNDGETAERLALSGPGIDGTIEIAATQTVRNAIDMRDSRNHEYPQGIDMIFISGAGDLSAVPRLTKVVR